MTFELDAELINGLAKDRPFFYSEADFQHALAWSIKKAHSDCAIHLEYRVRRRNEEDKRRYIDIVVKKGANEYAIELKYKTRAIAEHDLLSVGARDHGRYDFLKDIERLEALTRKEGFSKGYAIFLTNDPLYWINRDDKETKGKEFNIHGGREVRGRMDWQPSTPLGSKGDRTVPIVLTGTYRLRWQEYSEASDEKYGIFSYLLIEVIPH